MLLSWGRGKHGVLGHGDESDAPSPQRVLAAPPIAQIAAGELHCVALTCEGHVLAWGSGLLGALGHGTRASCYEPVEVVALRAEGDIVQVSAGRHHSLALSAAGEVLGWGACGAPGACSLLPRRQEELSGQGVLQIGCGDAYCAALTPQGAFAWGPAPLGGQATLAVRCVRAQLLACAPRRLLVLGSQGEVRLSRLLDEPQPTFSRATATATAAAAAAAAAVAAPPRLPPPLLPPTPGDRFSRLGAGARFCAALSTSGEVYVLLTGGGGGSGGGAAVPAPLRVPLARGMRRFVGGPAFALGVGADGSVLSLCEMLRHTNSPSVVATLQGAAEGAALERLLASHLAGLELAQLAVGSGFLVALASPARDPPTQPRLHLSEEGDATLVYTGGPPPPRSPRLLRLPRSPQDERHHHARRAPHDKFPRHDRSADSPLQPMSPKWQPSPGVPRSGRVTFKPPPPPPTPPRTPPSYSLSPPRTPPSSPPRSRAPPSPSSHGSLGPTWQPWVSGRSHVASQGQGYQRSPRRQVGSPPRSRWLAEGGDAAHSGEPLGADADLARRGEAAARWRRDEARRRALGAWRDAARARLSRRHRLASALAWRVAVRLEAALLALTTTTLRARRLQRLAHGVRAAVGARRLRAAVAAWCSRFGLAADLELCGHRGTRLLRARYLGLGLRAMRAAALRNQVADRAGWARFAQRAAALVRWRAAGGRWLGLQRLLACARGHWRGASIASGLQRWSAECAAAAARARRGAAAVAARRLRRLRRALLGLRTTQQLGAARLAQLAAAGLLQGLAAAAVAPRRAALHRWRRRAARSKSLLHLRLALRSADAAAWSAAAARALRALRDAAARHRQLVAAWRAACGAQRAWALSRWRGAAQRAVAIAAGEGRRRRSVAAAESLASLLAQRRGLALSQALRDWACAATLCVAADRRAAIEQRLRGLQQAVASGALRLQEPGFGQRAASGPQPAARSMVDKMASVIGVWETSRLASAFFVWSGHL